MYTIETMPSVLLSMADLGKKKKTCLVLNGEEK